MERRHVEKFLTKLFELAGEEAGAKVIVTEITRKDEGKKAKTKKVAV